MSAPQDRWYAKILGDGSLALEERQAGLGSPVIETGSRVDTH
ncbi:MAG: hypothetical protein QM650_09710 [Microlunatus sp.]